MSEKPDNVDKIIGQAIVITLGFSGVSIFLYQGYLFLRYDELFLFSAIDAIKIINKFTYFLGSWAREPKDWLGLHIVLSWTPMAPVLFFSALYIGRELD